MNRDIAPFPPPLGRHQPYVPNPDTPPAYKPARVPLWAAAAVTLVLVVAPFLVPGWGGAFLALAALMYGLPFVGALLVVAGLAKLTDSRAVGIGGTVLLFCVAALGLCAWVVSS